MQNYSGDLPVYIVMTPSMSSYNAEFGVTTPSNVTALLAELAKSPFWRLVANNAGTQIYQMSAAASTIAPGLTRRT